MDDRELRAAAPLIRSALQEDLGKEGDITSRLVISPTTKGRAAILFKEAGVICGLPLAQMVFHKIDRKLTFKYLHNDGDAVDAGKEAAVIIGRARSLLAAERTALNFLQRLSGIATLTRQYVSRVQSTGVKVYDTRKTLPGWRVLEKYAVRTGGGYNHRIGLNTGIMIKDNHFEMMNHPDALGKILRTLPSPPPTLVVEATSPPMAERIAQTPGIAWILLDNHTPEQLRESVRRVRAINPRITLEASGGIRLSNAQDIAASGVNCISVGELTHSPRAVDISLEMRKL